MMRRMGRPGLVGMAARTAVVAGTATAVAGGVRHHQDEKYAAQQAEAQQAPPPPPPAAAPAPAAAPSGDVDVTGELTKLADMKAQGLLTEEEFSAAKAKLLAG
jgi:hypothetical protein